MTKQPDANKTRAALLLKSNMADVIICSKRGRGQKRSKRFFTGIRRTGLLDSLLAVNCYMNVGTCKISLRIPENSSLKGKRQVVKSLIARIRNKFDIAVAEVDDNDLWQVATIGVCCVSNDQRHANQVLSRVVDFIINSHFDVEILDYEIEILTA